MCKALLLLCVSPLLSWAYNSPKYINYMLNTHHKLVPYYGHKYLKNKIIPYQEKKDIIQEGYIGLYYASRKYDETRNISFSYYSRFWIMRYFSVALKEYNKKQQLNYPLDDKRLYSLSTPKPRNTICLDSITPYQKDIITRRFLKHEKVKDIAKYYKVSRNTMSNHITYAVNLLRIINQKK